MNLHSAVQGHWVRQWIRAPGFEDHTTRVHWIQVGTAYADVRIPRSRPDIANHPALSALTAHDLALLAQAEGFAGSVTLQGDRCTWHRAINWHGTPDDPDIGSIAFDAEGHMIETGVHADYSERWVKHPTPAPRAQRFAGGGYSAYVVSGGDTVVIGIGRPDKPSTKPIIKMLNAGDIPQEAAALFDGLHAVGQWSGETIVPGLATNPFAEGRPIATLQDDSLIWHRIGFDGAKDHIALYLQSTP